MLGAKTAGVTVEEQVWGGGSVIKQLPWLLGMNYQAVGGRGISLVYGLLCWRGLSADEQVSFPPVSSSSTSERAEFTSKSDMSLQSTFLWFSLSMLWLFVCGGLQSFCGWNYLLRVLCKAKYMQIFLIRELNLWLGQRCKTPTCSLILC